MKGSRYHPSERSADSEERKRFLRIQVLREITTSTRQRIGLEPWGRLLVEYPSPIDPCDLSAMAEPGDFMDTVAWARYDIGDGSRPDHR